MISNMFVAFSVLFLYLCLLQIRCPFLTDRKIVSRKPRHGRQGIRGRCSNASLPGICYYHPDGHNNLRLGSLVLQIMKLTMVGAGSRLISS